MGRLDNTSHLLFSPWPGDPLQIVVQLTQSFWRVSHTDRSQLTPLFINAQCIVVIVCPIDAASETMPGKDELSKSVKPCGAWSRSPACSTIL
jgi:hypothetical protein